MNYPTNTFALWVVAVAGLVLGTQLVLTQTNDVLPAPPLAAMRSPVASFRALLAMQTAQRRQFLANCSTNAQQRLVQKIREYQALTPEQRELRLKATELRWYLQPLIQSPATNRAAQVALIPESLRLLVTARLEQWDRIPAPVQQMFLTNQQGADYLSRLDRPANYPPSPSTQIRQKLAARISQLFDLTPGEKERVLATLSEAERQQMEKTLETFHDLPPGQRKQCLGSLKQIAGMTPAERQVFVKNAQRWSQMTPAERQAWREVESAAPNIPALPLGKLPKPPLPASPRE
jgi:hypothetical protein